MTLKSIYFCLIVIALFFVRKQFIIYSNQSPDRDIRSAFCYMV